MGKITTSKRSLRLHMHDSWAHMLRRCEGTSCLCQGWLFLHPSLGNQDKSQTHKLWSVRVLCK